MAGFENTSIWQSTLAKQLGTDTRDKEREVFRTNYESFRENAALLGAEISRDLPEYTVHDITHIDALWEIASLICGEGYELNPAEAFVLGGAFLIHDLGMGLAAYPDGINELKSSIIWDDTKAYLSKSKPYLTKYKLEKEVTEVVLRALHAKHAEKLALISWGTDEKYYLINHPELRDSYGPIIGLIAHSHWWNSDEILEKLPNSLGAFSTMPNDWGIDPVKLACIMRVADASHIDSRRAPALLKEFRQLSEYSKQHWLFQQRLYQPRLESERLVYTSKSSFTVEESKSWWLCFETLKMIDNELRSVDSILGDTQRMRLKAKGVAAINNINMLARLIGTTDWYPVDTSIHVGNVAKLVKNLGGEQLYGKNNLVPLRELIQNSCDAVKARRLLESEEPDWGRVSVKTGTDDSGRFIEVEDNGVGMSVDVLSGPFLDFGTSFWGSSMMHNEFPGLESKGFSSTGKYGVGFFSTFMWGDRVSVTTRRFEDGRQDTKVLDFENGLSDRPILRKALKSEYIKEGGTRIRVYISDIDTCERIFQGSFGNKLEFSQIVEDLCPCMDVNIQTIDLDAKKKESIRKANDWQTLESEDFIKRVLGHKNFKELDPEDLDYLLMMSKNIRNILSDGEVIGRGFLVNFQRYKPSKSVSIDGVVTVGGFRTSGLTNIVGLFMGQASRASRDVCTPIASAEKIKEWVEIQESLIVNDTAKIDQLNAAYFVTALGGKPNNLIVANCKSGLITIDKFRDKLKLVGPEILITSTLSVANLERNHNGKIELEENVFVTEAGIPGILQTGSRSWSHWPKDSWGWFHDLSLEGVLIREFSSFHQLDIEKVKSDADFTSDDEEHVRVIGTINGIDIEDRVDIIRAT
ncbi:ATP-binding protein [Vibrio splendidus]|uniref:HD domain-containing protein n=1 Tax=Vibrio splendidus TaxID=29497 RepID=UPI00352FBEB6